MLRRNYRPVQSKSSKVLAQPVGVVGRGFAGARVIEELPASLGDGTVALANLHHLLQLQTVEEVESAFCSSLRSLVNAWDARPFVHCAMRC